MADPAEDTPSPQRVLWARLLGVAALAVAVGLVVLGVTRWNAWTGAARHQRTDDAYLEADLTPIAARVAGYVRAVPTQDFERVRAGQVIAQIDDGSSRGGLVGVGAPDAQRLNVQAQLARLDVRPMPGLKLLVGSSAR